MSVAILTQYLPENTLPHLKKWFGGHSIHIHITKGRESKLGDYRKRPDGSHMITVNSTLEPQLFFFVLTHEIAHLLAFHNFGYRIAPHGKEWKKVFGDMIMESLPIYKSDFQPILIKFSKSPKANFMASEDLVRYFHAQENVENISFVEDINLGERFLYRNHRYESLEKRKKNYLCINLNTGKKYIFKPIVQVEKLRDYQNEQQ